MKNRILKILAILILTGLCSYGGYLYGHKTSIVILPEPSLSLEQMIRSQPDNLFKANLLCVMGSHYSNDDAELSILLREWAKIKIKELTNNSNPKRLFFLL